MRNPSLEIRSRYIRSYITAAKSAYFYFNSATDTIFIQVSYSHYIHLAGQEIKKRHRFKVEGSPLHSLFILFATPVGYVTARAHQTGLLWTQGILRMHWREERMMTLLTEVEPVDT